MSFHVNLGEGPKAPMKFFFGQYIVIPKQQKIGHNRRGTTLEPLGKVSGLWFRVSGSRVCAADLQRRGRVLGPVKLHGAVNRTILGWTSHMYRHFGRSSFTGLVRAVLSTLRPRRCLEASEQSRILSSMPACNVFDIS